MASTMPATSQPLHDFSSLNPLNLSSGVARASSSTPHPSPQRYNSPDQPTQSPRRHSPVRNESPVRGGGESDNSDKKLFIEYTRQTRNPSSGSAKPVALSASPPDPTVIEEKLEKQTKGTESGDKYKARFLIKVPLKNKNSGSEAAQVKVQEEAKVEDVKIGDDAVEKEEGKQIKVNEEEGNENGDLEDEEQVPKKWNLRQRKTKRESLKKASRNGRSSSARVNSNKPEAVAEKKRKEKRKRGFTIALSREEIEEDFAALRGSRSARRGRRRTKEAQELLDNLFPGAWLQSITADSYEVQENAGGKVQ